MMHYQTLITAAELRQRIAQGGDKPRLVDCRFDLAQPSWGQAQYDAGHIPGAVYAHLDTALSGEKTGRNGRHPLPSREAFAAWLGAQGINQDTQIIAYDQLEGMYAARLWWLCRWLGHSNVAVLNGGWQHWQASDNDIANNSASDGGSVTANPTSANTFTAKPPLETRVLLDELRQRLAQGDAPVLDARAPERYRGEVEPLDAKAGHIPGAKNHFYKLNLQADGTFKTPAALRTAFETSVTAGQNATGSKDWIHSCGSGVTACHNILALRHAGLIDASQPAQLYAGSWSEWSSQDEAAIETQTNN